MKKISIISILALLAIPAMAKDTKPVADKIDSGVATTTESVNTEIAKTESVVDYVKDTKQVSNPKLKFPHGLQFGFGVSPTSGLNGFIGYNNKNFDSFWWKRLGIRFDLATYSPIKSDFNKELNETAGKGKDSIEIGDLAVENFAVDANHYGALIDFYPFGNTWFLGGWRISGGYFGGKLSFATDITSKNLGGTYQIELDGHMYEYNLDNAKGKAKVDWKYSGPYVGTGFDLGLIWGFKIYFDAGVVLADKPAHAGLNIPLDGLKDVDANALVSSNPTLLNQFNARKKEELRKVQDELDKYECFPIVKLGFMFRF